MSISWLDDEAVLRSHEMPCAELPAERTVLQTEKPGETSPE
jgi:hypothetical protein